MAARRVGCYYCFKTLDPQDKQDEFRTFVKCSHCGTIYHTVCWCQCEDCPRCGEGQAEPVNTSRPAPLRAVTKTRALPTKPSIIVYVRDEAGSVHIYRPITWRERTLNSSQVTRAILLAVYFLVIASSIGVFGYRISQLKFVTVEALMDTVFREPLPPTRTFTGAFVCGAVCMLAFYSRSRSSAPRATENTKETEEKESEDTRETEETKETKGVRRSTYFMAGVVILAGLDLVLFNVTPQDLVNLNLDLYPYREILFAQGATAFIMLVLVPLHRILAPTTSLPRASHSPLITSLYGWTRLLFVSLLLDLFVVYLATRGLPPSLNKPRLTDITIDSLTITLTLPMIGAFVSGIAIASIAYWSPKFREVRGHFGTLRLIVATLCVVSLGLMYRATSNSEGFLTAITIACAAMLAATPVQRALS